MYYQLLSSACNAAIRCPTALDAVVKAVKVLEDSPITNAGVGSNLCTNGTVECDASVMTGSPIMWAGIGGLSDIKNPVEVARKLYDSQLTDRPCGLASPILLIGKGAREFAMKEECEVADLVTESSKKSLEKYLKRLKEARLDTVGAVAIAKDGSTASAVSSGGVLVKTPGRLGQACSFGSGCWSLGGVSLTTSGVGEHIILSQLALRTGEKLHKCSLDSNELVVDVLRKSFECDFVKSPFLSHIKQEDRAAGVLTLVKNEQSCRVEVACVHNTPSMVFAYRSSRMKSASCDLSRCPSSSLLSIKAATV